MNQFGSEDRLSKALRRIAQESARNAPPDLGSVLAGAFRRHHRQRRLKNSAIIVLAIGCLLSTVWFFPKSTATPPTAHHTAKEPTVANADAVSAPRDTKTERKENPRTARVSFRHQASREKTQVASREPGDFLPLPAYDPSVAANRDLQIIRVQMPIQDLRLVGAPVNAAMPNRQVLADFVVGQDGTPYAVRLIQ